MGWKNTVDEWINEMEYVLKHSQKASKNERKIKGVWKIE